MIRINRAAIVGLLAVQMSAAVCAEVKVDRSLVARPAGLVDIYVRKGSVKVVGWDHAKVAVKGVLGDRTEPLEFSRGDRKVRVTVRGPKVGKDRDADLTIYVPRKSDIDAEMVQGPITTSGVSGQMEMSTVSGDIYIKGPCKKVEASTIDGGIILESPQASITAKTVGGAITVKKALGKGTVDLRTISGAITIDGKFFENVAMETVSGAIYFACEPQTGCSLSASTHNGKIIGSLPADLSAGIDIISFAGRIENEFSPEPQHKPAIDGSGDIQSFVVGDRDTRTKIKIDTFSGLVHLMKQK